ncbi:MAG: hypothetical protein WC513_08370 [Bacteroidales bacterium]|nr:hypothetical protein [Bacteroidales bacterium]MDD2832300.1 hypothetical protein [Bacteroidales bacterium]MDD4474079.1 hypothetical protein [Bacteroidales bacterium]MDD5047200.1 hypothetical protein [Bacteroidales bacterium]MDD5517586.1 hypothetical protein [Bacteroidales bacterium]
MNERVHFYSPGDMSAYYNLQKATPVIEFMIVLYGYSPTRRTFTGFSHLVDILDHSGPTFRNKPGTIHRSIGMIIRATVKLHI